MQRLSTIDRGEACPANTGGRSRRRYLAAIFLSLSLCVPITAPLKAATKRRASAAQRQAPPRPTHQIPTAGVLGEPDLVAIAKLKANAPDDKFSDDPTLAYVGRAFVVTAKGSSLDVDYDKDLQSLKVTVGKYFDSITLGRDLTPGAYTGQNAYGTKAAVARQRGNAYGIWLPGRPELIPEAVRPGDRVRYEARMDGPTARALSGALQARLTGTIIRAEGGNAAKNSGIFHKSLIMEPTVNSPADVWIDEYAVAVAFTKVEWIDGRTGKVIAVQDIGPQA